MDIIAQKVKQNYKSKAEFCTKNGHKAKDYSHRLKTVRNKIEWLNRFLWPLGLKVEIVEEDSII